MTRDTTEKLLALRESLTQSIARLDETIARVRENGVTSAQISSSGGSKNYSNISLAELNAERTRLVQRLNAVTRKLSGGTFINRIAFGWC